MNFEKVKFDFMNNQETLQETFTLWIRLRNSTTKIKA